MIVSAALSGSAGAAFYLIMHVSVATIRSTKRLECARLRDELVDAARLGLIDVTQPRVFGLIDWFDRVAATGRLITSGRHAQQREGTTSLTLSLLNALSPERQLAPVGPNFPLGPSWPVGLVRRGSRPWPDGAVVDPASGPEIEARALRYQKAQLGRGSELSPVRIGLRQTLTPPTPVVPSAPAPVSLLRMKPISSAAPVPARALGAVEVESLVSAAWVAPASSPVSSSPPSTSTSPVPSPRSPKPVGTSCRQRSRWQRLRGILQPDKIMLEPRVMLEPPRLEPARPAMRKRDSRRSQAIRQESFRSEPRRQIPTWDERVVDVTGHPKPPGGLVPVTGPIPISSDDNTEDDGEDDAECEPKVRPDTAPDDLKDRIFALPT